MIIYCRHRAARTLNCQRQHTDTRPIGEPAGCLALRWREAAVMLPTGGCPASILPNSPCLGRRSTFLALYFNHLGYSACEDR